jgi:hypothetical protein
MRAEGRKAAESLRGDLVRDDAEGESYDASSSGSVGQHSQSDPDERRSYEEVLTDELIRATVRDELINLGIAPDGDGFVHPPTQSSEEVEWDIDANLPVYTRDYLDLLIGYEIYGRELTVKENVRPILKTDPDVIRKD